MSNTFKPIQYSINNVVEMKEIDKHKLFENEDSDDSGEQAYSFEEDSREPLLNLEVSIYSIYSVEFWYYLHIHSPLYTL